MWGQELSHGESDVDEAGARAWLRGALTCLPGLARPLHLQGCLWLEEPWVVLCWFVLVSACSWISCFIGTLVPGSSPEGLECGLGCDLDIRTCKSPQGIILRGQDRSMLGTCLWVPFQQPRTLRPQEAKD